MGGPRRSGALHAPDQSDAAPRVSAALQAEAVLRETRQFYVAIDEDGVVRAWNRSAERVFGYSEEQAVGFLLEDLIIPPSHREAHRRGIEAFVRTGRGRGVDAPVEVQARRADGAEVPVALTIWAQSTASGYLFHALGSDLTERRAHERVLCVLAEHRRELLHVDRPEDVQRLLVDAVALATGCDAAWLYVPDDPHTLDRLCLVAESPGAAEPAPPVVQVRATDFLILRQRDADPSLDRGSAADALRARLGADLRFVAVEPVLMGEEVVGVLVVARRASEPDLPASTPDLLRLFAGEAGLVLQRLALRAQLAAAARTDGLTGLANRRAVDEALSRGLSRAARDGDGFVLVLVDLDRFKSYNDANGHPAGDELLRRVSAAWSSVVRGPDLLARIGSDEFALLLVGADHQAGAWAVAQLRAVTPPEASLTAGVAVRARRRPRRADAAGRPGAPEPARAQPEPAGVTGIRRMATVRLVPRPRPRARARRAATALLLALTVLVLPAPPSALAAHQKPPARTFTYDVQQRGAVSTDLEEFARHAAATLADPRGWSLGGSLDYERVPADGDFTLWLAESSTMRSFASACSPAYSCRVGRAVVVNEARWKTATPSWTGTLDDYRRYVVLHELGHWLQQGHVGCPGPGRPAPVMLQQSIDLRGCTANAWPLEQERAAVAGLHGVQAAGTGSHADTAATRARAKKLLSDTAP